MARRELSDATKRSLTEAIRDVEAGSSAEVVVAVRSSSASYLHADLLLGCVVALVVLAALLFLPIGIGLAWLVVDPFVAGLATTLASGVLGLGRRLTPAAQVRRDLQRAARATFVERGVHATRGRTGILVYLSLRERGVVLVADHAVERAVPLAELALAEQTIAAAFATGGLDRRLAEAFAPLARATRRALPRADDDVNELPDEVSSL